MKINKKSKLFIAGHNGLVGKAILKEAKNMGFTNIITIEKKKLDLMDQKRVFSYLKKIKPHGVIIAAAKVGGIMANSKYKANFIYDNLSIQNNLIHGSYLSGVKNLIFLGSSCIYPKITKLPIKESALLTGSLENTNEPYAIAKIAGLKLCESYNYQYNTNYKCLMPCNIYGEGDNYDSESSHFFPALLKKIYDAKLNNLNSITLWGNGMPKRELLNSLDLAKACLFFLDKKTSKSLINIGSGIEMSIKNYAEFIIKELKLNLKIKYDRSKPNGTIRKLIDSSYARKYGWRPKISLKKGFKLAYKDYLIQHKFI